MIYENSPRTMIENFGRPYNKDQILGGEAALWAEQVRLICNKSVFSWQTDKILTIFQKSLKGLLLKANYGHGYLL